MSETKKPILKETEKKVKNEIIQNPLKQEPEVTSKSNIEKELGKFTFKFRRRNKQKR